MGFGNDRLKGGGNDREKNDFYPTPSEVTKMLLEKEEFPGVIWEPACGDRAISKLLPGEVISTDLYERGFGTSGVDFLRTNKSVDHIVTNPPYSLAKEFVIHSLDCASGKVALLLKLNFLEGSGRYRLFKETPLRTVYVFSNRISFDRGMRSSKGNGLLAFAWFVWEKGYNDRPGLDWLIDSRKQIEIFDV